MKLLVKIVLLMMLPLSGLGVVKYEMIRPLEIHVVDATTKQPLSNIVVYYKLETLGMPHVFGIPLIDPVRFRDVRMERFVTDKNGMVNIPKYRLWLGLYEGSYSEEFTVNLDIEQGDATHSQQDTNKIFFDNVSDLIVSSQLRHLYRSNEQYKGSVLHSGFSSFDELLRKELKESCIVEVKHSKRQKEKQFITFELERTDNLNPIKTGNGINLIN